MKALTKRQKTTLKRHKKHHTAKHMTALKKAMRKGKAQLRKGGGLYIPVESGLQVPA